MRIFNTICKKCGKHCDEDVDYCFVCGSISIYYQSDLTKKERRILDSHTIYSGSDYIKYFRKEWDNLFNLIRNGVKIKKRYGPGYMTFDVHETSDKRLLPIPPKVPKLKISKDIKDGIHRELKRQRQDGT